MHWVIAKVYHLDLLCIQGTLPLYQSREFDHVNRARVSNLSIQRVRKVEIKSWKLRWTNLDRDILWSGVVRTRWSTASFTFIEVVDQKWAWLFSGNVKNSFACLH